MLHITNGESVTGTFRQVRLPGSYLAWKDVLYDGAVPQTQTLNELSDIRAQALAGFGWGNYEKIRAEFTARDQTLKDFRKHTDVVLWFEHDLFDQLQLLQLLDWFAQQDSDRVRHGTPSAAAIRRSYLNSRSSRIPRCPSCRQRCCGFLRSIRGPRMVSRVLSARYCRRLRPGGANGRIFTWNRASKRMCLGVTYRYICGFPGWPPGQTQPSWKHRRMNMTSPMPDAIC